MKNPLNPSDDIWRSKPHIIRRFIESRHNYEKLAEEIAYILESGVKRARLEYSSVSYRCKSLSSFCEKMIRKRFKDPLREITDLAGVRIIHLYSSDRAGIESIIESEFKVIEKVDKVEKEEPDRFGYGALHYLVKMGKGASGARYDDLKNLVCEIQVRTILQDAWALVAHHLSYKKESDIPKKLRRKLNALAGLFETADNQFDQLNIDRTQYAQNIEKTLSAGTPTFQGQEINLDNLYEYLKWRFPERKINKREEVVDLPYNLKKLGYKSLGEIDRLLYRTEGAVKVFETKYPPSDIETGEAGPFAPVGVVRVAIAFVNDQYRAKMIPSSVAKHYDEFMHLVKPEAPAEQSAARRRPKRRVS